MTLADIGVALSAVTVNCSRYHSHKQPDRYIVWAEDGQGNSGYADNKLHNQTLTGTVDYFTTLEDDGNVAKIQTALNSLNIAWRLNSIQYEDDTSFIHYEWVWSGMFANG